MIGFGCTSDWIKKWQNQLLFDTQMKTALKYPVNIFFICNNLIQSDTFFQWLKNT